MREIWRKPYPNADLMVLLSQLIVAYSEAEFSFDLLYISEVVFKDRTKGAAREIAVSNIATKTIKDRWKELEEVARNGGLKVRLSWDAVQPTRSRFMNVKRQRDQFAHGRLYALLTDEGVSPTELLRAYNSWKANPTPISETVKKQELEIWVKEAELLGLELFEIQLGLRPGASGSASATARQQLRTLVGELRRSG